MKNRNYLSVFIILCVIGITISVIWFTINTNPDSVSETEICLPVTGGNNSPYGYINLNGELQVPMKVKIKRGEKLSLMTNGIAHYRDKKTKNIVFITSENPEETIETTHKYSLLFNEGYALIVNKSGSLIFLDKEFKEHDVLPDNTFAAGNFFGGYAKFQSKNGKWGFIDKSGKVVVKAVYDNLTSFSAKNGTSIFKKNGTLGYISAKNLDAKSVGFNEISHFVNNFSVYIKTCSSCEKEGCDDCGDNPVNRGFITSEGITIPLPKEFVDRDQEISIVNGYAQVYSKDEQMVEIFEINPKQKKITLIKRLKGSNPVYINSNGYFINNKDLYVIKKVQGKMTAEDNSLDFSGSENVLPLFNDVIFVKKNGFWSFYSSESEEDIYLGRSDLNIEHIRFGKNDQGNFEKLFVKYNVPIDKDKTLKSSSKKLLIEDIYSTILTIISGSKELNSKAMIKNTLRHYDINHSTEATWREDFNLKKFFITYNMNNKGLPPLTSFSYTCNFKFDKKIISNLEYQPWGVWESTDRYKSEKGSILKSISITIFPEKGNYFDFDLLNFQQNLERKLSGILSPNDVHIQIVIESL